MEITDCAMKNDGQIKVVLATGHGPLHFIESGTWIARSGVRLRMILGWVPKNADSFLCRLTSKVVGRDLSVGFKRRMLPDAPFEVVTTAFSEFVNQAMRRICALFGKHSHIVDSWTWALLGFQSRQYLKGFDILQVRTGAGQGGLIKTAKRCGMKVIADHSALHPVTCGENLRDDYARWGQTLAIGPGLGVWKNVEKDCRQADLIVVNADHIKDSFVVNGYPPEKIKVAYLGVRKDFMGIKTEYNKSGPVRILYTGAFSILKGAEYLLEAIRILTERGVEVECTIVGNIDAPAKLRDKYAHLPVKYLGRVAQDELVTYLKECDIYLFPSLADGCAKSGMEAMAAGMCVVATRESGLPITDGENGFFVPKKDATAIADKIEWLASHQEEQKRLGRNAARLIRENYTWERYVEAIKKIYNELLNK